MSEQKKTRLWMAPTLKERQRKGDFGWLPDEVALKAALEAGYTPDEKGVVDLKDTREVRALLAKVGTVPAGKAAEQMAQAKAKVAQLGKFNQDLVLGNPDFADLFKQAEVVTSLNVYAEAEKGRRDFKKEVEQSWELVHKLQTYVLPKRQEAAKAFYDAALASFNGDAVATESLDKAYAKVTAETATIGDVEAFITERKKRGIFVKLGRENSGNGGNSQPFNTAKVVAHDPSGAPWKPAIPRGASKKEGGRRARA